ncbi:hypothetical protein [Aneurinibacillus aneurinilyticus]|jgi:hypothetical protein|uniref:Uncharacterized protein n=2 Tax=Aneurinibacillus aneurinilyticus TaxID=1391 RepID=A0A848D391_ANEAE|nr:hypothetical protein [Aneurinibacillus aneurinilyticus]ERI07579.1 hypothetical protein HMPREF0083_04369 [Aneurinibacillus aneurinilyticus ATCC 12856]MCI1695696.1 hypothetical protein [Aneurinibacillus aneurinilyticus]MED0669720.1 hypothetical protein [Aneurinibacillus aneurinilyticus]MED0707686.1 hypothetical protein [Aneurinibacillus aneurinilyticus]MED0722780.1 hypothetical protein [Aneurinibacillus aneurinilyticus]
MKVYATVKQLGKRKNHIGEKEIELAGSPETLRQLIMEVVTASVKEFNHSLDKHAIFMYLTEEELENRAALGKVGFKEKHNTTKEDEQKAAERALLAFEDGLYKVLINKQEIESLDAKLTVQEDDRLVFIKLTMLSGRMW